LALGCDEVGVDELAARLEDAGDLGDMSAASPTRSGVDTTALAHGLERERYRSTPLNYTAYSRILDRP
jgi:hypothetical protein